MTSVKHIFLLFVLWLAWGFVQALTAAQENPRNKATAAIAALQPSPAQQQHPPAVPPAKTPTLPVRSAPTGLILEEGTPVKMKISQTVSSADAQVGQTVDFEVLEDVKVNDVLVIPHGGLAWATVTEAQPKRRMGRAGRLNINIVAARLVTGESVSLRAVKEVSGGSNVGKMTGAIVATSIVFFPAAPLFLLAKGKNITIPKGTEITAYVNGNVSLDMAKFQAADQAKPADVPVPVAALAQFEISSTPGGADIELDGDFVGSTPSSISVQLGEHMVLIKKPGFKSYERKIKAAGGRVSITAVLEAEGMLQEPALGALIPPRDQKESARNALQANSAQAERSLQIGLSKDDMQAAIDSGKAKAKKKCKDIGLNMWDWTGYANAYHQIWVYTPRTWVEHQSCEATLNDRDVSLTEADAQPVLRVYVVPGSVPKEARSANSPCPSLRTVVLADGARMNLLRPQSEEKQTVRMRSRYDWGTFNCEMIVAKFSLSGVAALRALTPNAEFLVYVLDDTAGIPQECVWRVRVQDFKKLQ